MGQALNLLADWAALNPAKNDALEKNVKVLARWLSDAQRRHIEISRCLQKTWTPILSDGRVVLPEDFIRIKEDTIFWENDITLTMIPYEIGLSAHITSPTAYSIHDGYLYIWGAADGDTAEIVYEYRSEELTETSIKTLDLDIPIEFHRTLLLYLDMMWERTKDSGAWLALNDKFTAEARDDGTTNFENRYGVPIMRGNWL